VGTQYDQDPNPGILNNELFYYPVWRSHAHSGSLARPGLAIVIYKWNLDNSNCRGSPKSLSYQTFDLCSPIALAVGSPFRSNIFHFLAKLSKTCEIFFSREKKTMKSSFLRKNVNTSSHRKGNFMTQTPVYQLLLKVGDMPSKFSLPRRGPWNLVWVMQVFELSVVELTKFHCNCCIIYLYMCSINEAFWSTIYTCMHTHQY